MRLQAQVSVVLKKPDLNRFGKHQTVATLAASPDAVSYFEG